VDQLKEGSRYLIEVTNSISVVNRSYYESLIERGFSEQQALELVKVHGLSLKEK